MIKLKLENIDRYFVLLLIVAFMIGNISFVNLTVMKYVYFLLFLLLSLYHVFIKKDVFNKTSIKNNKLVVIFLIIQLIIFILFRFSVSSISLFFNEFFYLFIIYLFSIKNKGDALVYYKSFIILNFIFNVISIICCYLSYFNIINLVTFDTSVNSYVTGIYSNPNGMGVISLIALILYFSYFFKPKDINSYIFTLFNVLMIYVSQCRTAIYALFFFLVFYSITFFFKKHLRKLIISFNVIMIVGLGCYYGYMYFNKNELYLNKYELKLDGLLTHRYMMNKYSLLSLGDDLLIGMDNSEIAHRRFNTIPYTIRSEMSESEIRLIYNNSNNHNSFTQIIVNLGLIIFIIFMIFLCRGMKYTYYKNIPIIMTILLMSFFEGNLAFAKGIVMLLFMILLADRYKEKYHYNCDTILYINYIDTDDNNSGSGVRPNKMYQAFKEAGYDVKMLTGTILKEKKNTRIKNIKEIEDWLINNRPKFCYIESPGEPIIYQKDRDLISLIHYYNIPISYFYRDCYHMFPKIYIFNETKITCKSIIKYLYNYMRYKRDDILIKSSCDIVYFPSQKMSELFSFYSMDALPPGCDIESTAGDKIIYVGALSENYGTDLMLDAMEKVNKKKKIGLILVCRESEYKKYETRCKKYSWLEVYHVSGSKELNKIYQKAKIALLPKKKNAYNDFAVSVKFFEYVGYGIPIIATSCFETDRIINNSKIGLIANEDVDDFANKILCLYENTRLYSSCKENISLFAKENTWNKRVEKIAVDFENGDYYE